MHPRLRRYPEAASALRVWATQEGAADRRVVLPIEFVMAIMGLFEDLARGAPEPDTTASGPISALLRQIEILPDRARCWHAHQV